MRGPSRGSELLAAFSFMQARRIPDQSSARSQDPQVEEIWAGRTSAGVLAAT